MISKETIELVLSRNDIESLIGSYVSLKRAGSNLKGLCPFHSEKTPSFTVYPADNSFYCFGCGAGGDAINFIRKRENLDYPDAVEFLAKRAGITIIRDEDKRYSNEPKFDRAKMFRMNVDAAKFFNKELYSDTPEAKNALAYFTEKRKLSLATINHFGLGYSPNSFDRFSRYMLNLGYTYEELVAGFLCGKSENGRYYDAFRNRVMFPIIDVSGNVIAFGGRVMDDNVKPKYKNSSDTPVFKKSRNLFALNFARHHSSESLILCEGYMDVIALHAAGFENAVATLGTAITSDQARLLSRYTKKVIISYDADEAGQKATARAMKLLNEVGMEVKILKVPEAKDPDEFIKRFGAERFKTLLSESKNRFGYSLDNVLSKYDIRLQDEKVKALHEIERIISEIYSAAEREIYIRDVAGIFELDPVGIKNDVDKLVMKNTRAKKREESDQVKRDMVGYSDRVNPDYVKAPAVASNEENVLGLLLLYSEHRKKVFDEDLLSSDDFYTELNKRFFEYIKECYFNGDSGFTDMNEKFTSDEVGRLTQIKYKRMDLSDNGCDVLLSSINSLKNVLSKKKSENINSIDALKELLNNKRIIK